MIQQSSEYHCNNADTMKVVKACCRLVAGGNVVLDSREICYLQTNYADIVQLARVESVIPHLLSTLRYFKTNSNIFSSNHVWQSHSQYIDTARAMLLGQEWHKLSRIFAEQDVAVIQLKGPALAAYLYGDDCARSSIDIDLLVHKEQLLATLEILQSQGYRLDEKYPDLSSKSIIERQVSCCKRASKIDLHWLPISQRHFSYWRVHDLNHALWSSCKIIDYYSQIPSPPVLLLYLALHGWYHDGRLSLKTITDVAALINRRWRAIDWHSLYRLIVDLEAVVPTRTLLDAVKAEGMAVVPDQLLQGLRPTGAMRYFETRSTIKRRHSVLARFLRWFIAGGLKYGKTELALAVCGRSAIFSNTAARYSAALAPAHNVFRAILLCIRMSIKRMLDTAVSGAFLIILTPLLALIAIAIKLESGSPVLFCQDRIGRNNRKFKIWKFRTLYLDAPRYNLKSKLMENWITRVGGFLRRTALDELPQLVNVLKGDMSLVGPRPEMPMIVDGYSELEKARLAVKPGITGLWQLEGDHERPIHEHLGLDLYYIARCSPCLDAWIIVRTIGFVFKSLFCRVNM